RIGAAVMPGRRAATFGADRARRAAETDRWLVSLLGGEAGVALVAVGGYGRRELLPGSDLDEMLLHAGRPDIATLADRIWYPGWGHASAPRRSSSSMPGTRCTR